MPQVLPVIAFAAFNAGVPLVVVNAIIGIGTAGVILHTAVSTAITIGASYASRQAHRATGAETIRRID